MYYYNWTQYKESQRRVLMNEEVGDLKGKEL
jgi:hypothetical protein